MKMTKKTALMFSSVMVVLAVIAVAVFAYPSGLGKERGHARPFIEPILMGHGFALNGNEYHILDVSVIKTINASPGFIHSLLLKKKSPTEITKEINDAQMSTRTRGHLRFEGNAYALNITSYDNQSLTADVLTLPNHSTNQTSFTPTVIGHISLSMSKYEGEALSTGNLTINGTDFRVLLNSPMTFRKW
jgi:hypothetical protein